MNERDIRSALILGGSGGFGRVFAERLTALDVAVTTADVVSGSDIRADICREPEAFVDALNTVELVLLCLPEAVAGRVLVALDGKIKNRLIVDICCLAGDR